MTAFAKIAISLPVEDLDLADRLAHTHDRSRSWIVAEAIRRLGAELERAPTDALGLSRSTQLARDLALTAAERIREAEDVADVSRESSSRAIEQPRIFHGYDEFAEWRREQNPSK